MEYINKLFENYSKLNFISKFQLKIKLMRDILIL